MNQRQIQLAQQRLQARAQGQGMQVPRGAQFGAIAGGQGQGQVQGQQMMRQSQRQPNPAPGGIDATGMGISPGLQQKIARMQMQAQGLAVPQGAEAAALAGCGDGDCMESAWGQPFAGYPPFPQPYVSLSLMPLRSDFGTDTSVTLSVSCANKLFYGCCARSFIGAGEIDIASIVAGGTDANLLCSGGLDLSYFNTNGNQCCCEFDFGCFSSFFPLVIQFDLVGTPSVPPLINMVIGGTALTGGNACTWWPGLTPGGPVPM